MVTRPNAITVALLTVAVQASVWFPRAAQAQTRPTLTELEARLDALATEVCAKTDTDGDVYRPLTCDPACNCFDPADYAGADTYECEETSSGTFALTATTIQDRACGFGNSETCSSGACSQSSGSPCTYPDPEQDDCPSGEACAATNVCFLPCGDDESCGNFSTKCEAAVQCVDDGDCTGPGDTCVGFLVEGAMVNYCTQTCSVDADCAYVSGVDMVDLSGVGDPASLTPAACEGSAATSRDALECVSDWESFASISCAFLCGNGFVDAGEQCDDGNTTAGDGCDALCQIEP